MANYLSQNLPYLRWRRQRQGFSQNGFGHLMGVQESIVSLWERCRRPVPGDRIPEIAKTLDCTPEDLGAQVTEAPPTPPAPVEIPPEPEPEPIIVSNGYAEAPPRRRSRPAQGVQQVGYWIGDPMSYLEHE